MNHRIEKIDGGYRIIDNGREYKIITTKNYIGIEDKTAYIPIPKKLWPILFKQIDKAIQEAKEKK